jgi:hypothetical protein
LFEKPEVAGSLSEKRGLAQWSLQAKAVRLNQEID